MLRKDTAYIRGYATGHNAQAASAGANVAKHMQAELTAHMLRLLRRQLIRREVAKMLLKAVEKKSTEVNMWAIGRMELAGSKQRVTSCEDIDSDGADVRI